MMFHPFHMVEKSPWPFSSCISSIMITMSSIMMFHFSFSHMISLALIILLLTLFQWWRDVSREASLQGLHSSYVLWGLKFGMILFIISEIFFFISFFWAFFHSSLSPNIEIGVMWPPLNIFPFNPFEIPLLNTTILISSGISISWSHHSIINNNFKQAFYALLITIMLGILFSILQMWEYKQAQFSMSDSIFGSTFFMTTGFHGIHVIIGTTFLIVSFFRMNKNLMSSNHHFGFEAAAWYWHFVDVVWLFLFTFMYWWIF
uniref:Cytochrome c oxidase subunit 3 n=2 Tax=Ixodes ricinus TaxID=34613 RepID=A0A088BDJ0_IXORI|nr:cytochrome c oxidase subunit 3 [Ixodes ricinus]AGW06716.1 cytochrome c oxidase subunit 3 [Ixodes ricinus]AGW06729.1 cytochrome c oxidase subunit 3 [Ixodes ricinus]AGW06742.1 cytochrome c oxidase subunit 3 [Ixodes ricinus]AGW06755.1 cytochrome c oxidase subunit 3 [Ixodes ricinus]